MSVGNRVFLKRNLPDSSIVEAFKQLPAANVADTMGRSCALSSEIRLISSPDLPIMARRLTWPEKAMSSWSPMTETERIP